MNIFRLFEVIAVIILAVLVVGQIIVPAIRGTHIFPWFRKEHDLKEQLLDVNQEAYEAELEAELARRRKELHAKMKEIEERLANYPEPDAEKSHTTPVKP